MNNLTNEPCKIVVVGVGGGGCNAINAMIQANIKNVTFVGINTDTQALAMCRAQTKVQIGKELTRGLGSGAKPDTGRNSALESRDEILEVISDANMLFIATGMGGGTGTGASPVIAELAREKGILTIAVVTKPFNFEGQKRMANAEEGIENIKQYVDSLLIIPNQKLLDLPEAAGLSVVDAFKLADKVLLNSIRGVTDIITNCSTINLDFADVRTVLRDSGTVLIGIGSSKINPAAGNESSVTKAILETVKDAIYNQLIEINIRNAKDVIVNIVAGKWFKMSEVDNICSCITTISNRPDINLMLGLSTGPEYEDNITITVIATGFNSEPQSSKQSISTPMKTYADDNVDIRPEGFRPSIEKRGVSQQATSDDLSDNDSTIVALSEDAKKPSFLRKFSKRKRID